MENAFIAMSLVAGSLLAVQAGANAQLSRAVGSPIAATTIQVLIAGVLLLVGALSTGTVAAFGALPHVPWWHAIGGIATALYVASTIILFPRLGAIVTVGLFIAGQMLASLWLGAFGAFGVPVQTLSAATALGTLAVLAGATAIVLGQKGATDEISLAKCGWIALALLAGAALPVQGAINGLLRSDLGAPFVVGTISFAGATLTMAIVLLLTVALSLAPKPQLAGLGKMPWWGWLGAFCGATYVTTVFTAIPTIGTAAAIGLTVAGQQIASIFVDYYGWFRLPKRHVTSLRLLGVALLLVGVAAIQIA